ncbi:hypothetical protein ACFQS3_18040 [Glycomyces mayteni]|uniref:CD-NTase-associated protein 15 domain-containing protein n=1 Tax=Glycomyces mayteni TaxID=543887 RepID=A0ABW2DBY4_9ACTN|nr:hypothetical protein GCM10025732_00750 [Glycomyces mayteni]
MKHGPIVRVVVAVVVMIFIAVSWWQTGKADLTWVRLSSTAIFVSAAILGLWDVWLWRTPLVQRIPVVPRCVRGTWKGQLASNWRHPDRPDQPVVGEVYLVVKQTSTSIEAKLVTCASQSNSTVAKIAVINNNILLTYIYMSEPDLRVQQMSKIHYGTTVLEVIGSPSRRMKGRYWTDRGTSGELNFNQYRRKIAGDFEEAVELFSNERSTEAIADMERVGLEATSTVARWPRRTASLRVPSSCRRGSSRPMTPGPRSGRPRSARSA